MSAADVTDRDRDDAHSYEHPDCEACGLEICASEFTCGCPPERAGRRLRVDGMRTQLHAVCEARFIAEFAAAKTDKVAPLEAETHRQTVEGGMGQRSGGYRRDCSCGFRGPWVSLSDAMATACPKAVS